MKSLIVLKGLAKTSKLKWVHKEGLDNFFLDIDVIRKLYSSPELVTPFKETLSKSFGDTVYSEFMKVLVTKLSKGCLVVVDPENEGLRVFENLAIIFGYTVFYVLQDIPRDYITRQKQYSLPYYSPKRKEELRREVSSFMSLDFNGKLVIKSYQDVESYWERKCRSENYYRLGKNGKPVLHISDIHSNWSMFKSLPPFKKYSFRIFHGDYIDGPEEGGSRKMIDLVCKQRWSKNTIWLEGNHELRLRKQLGIIMLTPGNKYKELRDILFKTIPVDYLRSTYQEFSDITPEKARDYLEQLNRRLKLFVVLESGGIKYICTHSGIKYIEQISPKFIGNVIYGNRDMNRMDKDFSSHTQNSGYWSIHAHCKYYGDWCIHKYQNVVNLDPPSNEEIVYAEQDNNNWKACQLKR